MLVVAAARVIAVVVNPLVNMFGGAGAREHLKCQILMRKLIAKGSPKRVVLRLSPRSGSTWPGRVSGGTREDVNLERARRRSNAPANAKNSPI